MCNKYQGLLSELQSGPCVSTTSGPLSDPRNGLSVLSHFNRNRNLVVLGISQSLFCASTAQLVIALHHRTVWLLCVCGFFVFLLLLFLFLEFFQFM